ncbi:MAG: arylsulfotransferase family protein [Actinomycetota bacterium]|nr:arylsulfotransferase family protein [Actinomycetota bacterium]
MKKRHTRRKFLEAAGAGAAWITLAGTLGCEPDERSSKAAPSKAAPLTRPEDVRVHRSPIEQPEDVWHFRSRPDLRPPAIKVDMRERGTAPGYVFVAPKKGDGQYGTLILDNSGEPVWFRPLQNRENYPMDFKVQQYRGEPVLTWCDSKVIGGHGFGEYVILDTSYREIARVRAGHGYKGDHHEFLITPRNTALLTAYGRVRGDLSSIGGPKDGMVWDGVAQEVDIETGEVLFEWHSIDHVGVEESHADLSEDDPLKAFCYFHINSIDVDHDGNLLISSRNTFAVYKVDRETGEIIWRLGGKKSDFEMGPGTCTRFQHDARRRPDGTITIFDNGGVKLDGESFGIALELDMEKMTATLARRYAHPEDRFSDTQGNVQTLQNGNVFVGWGSAPSFSEFSEDGELLFSASFPDSYQSYRAFRFEWSGHPTDGLGFVAERESKDQVTVYVSWNGSTKVATWEVLAGPDPNELESLGAVPRAGFETAITVRTTEPYVGVRARDSSDRTLGKIQAVNAIELQA